MHGVAAVEQPDAREPGERQEHELAHQPDDDARGLAEPLLELGDVHLRSLSWKEGGRTMSGERRG